MRFFDKIRDILYDSVNYLLMLGIIVVVVGVIGWRLDILFEKDNAIIHPVNQVVVDNSSRDNDLDEIASETSEPEDVMTEEEPLKAENSPEISTPPKQNVSTMPAQGLPSTETVKITIPDGSMPGKIALILEESGLIPSSRAFIAKSVELQLDTKLKSGTYKISKGLPVEDVVKIIAR